MSPGSLVDKSILVIGARSGIGKATAKLLAANGDRLIVAARSFDKLQSFAQDRRISQWLAMLPRSTQ
jgi:NADP-dependent 3-hydroxy acid dehydrogenase YdfG